MLINVGDAGVLVLMVTALNAVSPKVSTRLKTDVTRVAVHPAGFGIYRFRYLWSDVSHIGVMAQEVRERVPEAVVCDNDGFLRVDYAAIGMQMDRYPA
jgi:hypothetical protein